MRIVFAGTPEFAVPALQALIASAHQVVGVYTQPDRPAGRGKRLRASPAKQAALAAGIPVYQPHHFKDPTDRETLKGLQPDLMVVAAYGLILPQAVLDIPRHGCINIHASLLPRWRGAAPIQRAILAGDVISGVTIMQMAAGLDTGDMLLRRETPIGDADTAASLHDRLADMGAEALLTVLEQIQNGSISPEKQDDSLATYAAKLEKSEASIDWSADSDAIVRAIRAFNPWPVAQSSSANGTLRIWEAATDFCNSEQPPGTVLEEDRQQGILVQAGSGGVRIKRLQLPGGKPLDVADFLNSRSMLGVMLR